MTHRHGVLLLTEPHPAPSVFFFFTNQKNISKEQELCDLPELPLRSTGRSRSYLLVQSLVVQPRNSWTGQITEQDFNFDLLRLDFSVWPFPVVEKVELFAQKMNSFSEVAVTVVNQFKVSLVNTVVRCYAFLYFVKTASSCERLVPLRFAVTQSCVCVCVTWHQQRSRGKGFVVLGTIICFAAMPLQCNTYCLVFCLCLCIWWMDNKIRDRSQLITWWNTRMKSLFFSVILLGKLVSNYRRRVWVCARAREWLLPNLTSAKKTLLRLLLRCVYDRHLLLIHGLLVFLAAVGWNNKFDDWASAANSVWVRTEPRTAQTIVFTV